MLINFIFPVAYAGLFILLFFCEYSVYVVSTSRYLFYDSELY